MADSPNTSPPFIQTVGTIALPIQLTNQVCTRDNPGTTPVTIYDSGADYNQENGALIEMIDIQLTGVTVDTVVMLFDQYDSETTPVWRKVGEVAVPAVSPSLTTAVPSYKIPLKDILSPVPHAGAGVSQPPQQFQGLRVNSSNIKLGVALTVANTTPIIVRLYGGFY